MCLQNKQDFNLVVEKCLQSFINEDCEVELSRVRN